MTITLAKEPSASIPHKNKKSSSERYPKPLKPKAQSLGLLSTQDDNDNHEPTTTTESVLVKMSATPAATRPAAQKKTFGKSTREVPHHTQKAQKWYPAEDEYQPKKVSSHLSQRHEAAVSNCERSIGGVWSPLPPKPAQMGSFLGLIYGRFVANRVL